MCGRVFVKSTIPDMVRRFEFAHPGHIERLGNGFPIWNGAPSLTYPIIIREELSTSMAGFVSAKWGLVPGWARDGGGRPPPVNARCETIASNGLFRKAYAARRCLVPVDGYFEWQKLDPSGKKKQPYAIAMKDDDPFAMAGIWEEYADKATGELIRTFAVVTCEPNTLMATIHDRMPVILAPADYMRWLGPETDPRDLMKPYPSDLMKMWPIASGVGKPSNNTPDIIDEIGLGPTDLFDV
ncbi:SOS response-associated peptidase [Mesorhizobium sp. M1342]|uniref:SOS response-associated peptidase n=1 Tax=Mesorhizobium sp. M1342 TaxID=2957088 RepID=UPI00333D6406